MGRVLQIIGGSVTAPGTTETLATPIPSIGLKTAGILPGTDSHIISMWDYNNLLGRTRIIGQRFHDSVVGNLYTCTADTPIPITGESNYPKVNSSETLQLFKSGSAVGGDIEFCFMLLHHENVPGIQSHFIDDAELSRRGINRLIRRYVITSGAGDFGANVALDSVASFRGAFKQNRQYAVVGINSNSSYACSSLQGKYTGNFRVGYGGLFNYRIYQTYFQFLSKTFNAPLIPVFDGLDATTTYLSICHDTASALTINAVFVELSPE